MSSLERELLRRLCNNADYEILSTQVFEKLGQYSWQEHDHAVVFEALTGVNARGRDVITQESLAAETTRMGFPDIDWGEYFSSRAPEQTLPDGTESKQTLAALIEQLNSAARG